MKRSIDQSVSPTNQQKGALESESVRLEQALSRILLNSLSPVTLGLTLFYGALTIAHQFALPKPISIYMSVVAGITTLALLVINRLINRVLPPLGWAHPIASLIAALVLINTLTHFYLQPEPQQTTNVLLFVIAVSCLYTSPRWLALALSAAFLGWFLIAWSAPPAPQWSHFVFALCQSMVISILIFIIRYRNISRVEALLWRDQQRQAELKIALGITESARQELAESQQEIQQSEERFRRFTEISFEGIAIHEKAIIIDANPAMANMFGYLSIELIGMSLLELVTTPARETLWNGLLAAEKHYQLVGLKKDQTTFPIEFYSKAIHYQGRDVSVIAIRDLSESREVDRLKKEFIATVSHELRTPITAMHGSLSLLAGGVLGDLSSEAQEVVSIAERNANRLIHLINDILDLEQLDSGKLAMEFDNLALETIFDRASAEVRAVAAQADITVTIEPSAAKIFADRDRIVQVLVNLLSNAIKFSPAGSTIIISARHQQDQVEVRVTDRGRGIPVASINKIFDRFKQLDGSDTRKQGGTGLGLAICKAIIEQHQGLIGVESVEGQGSSFWFRLPAAKCEQLTELTNQH